MPDIEKMDAGAKPYEDFRADGKNIWYGWGNIVHNGNVQNMYTSEEVIQEWIAQPLLDSLRDINTGIVTLADFGGAAGATLEVVRRQLLSEKIEPYDIDANEEAVARGRNKFPDIKFIKSKLSSINLDDNFFDAGYSRFAIQYNPLVSHDRRIAAQEDVLKEIYRVMKPGAPVVLIWPAARNKRQFPAYNHFFNSVYGYIYGETPTRTLRGLTDPETMLEMASRVGFKFEESKELGAFPTTAEAFYNRFSEKMKTRGATLSGLKRIYNEALKKNRNLLDTQRLNGEQVVVGSVWRVVLKK
jgi:ubiquinone/menaquinone biosynthesis C-methylase UbiE